MLDSENSHSHDEDEKNVVVKESNNNKSNDTKKDSIVGESATENNSSSGSDSNNGGDSKGGGPLVNGAKDEAGGLGEDAHDTTKTPNGSTQAMDVDGENVKKEEEDGDVTMKDAGGESDAKVKTEEANASPQQEESKNDSNQNKDNNNIKNEQQQSTSAGEPTSKSSEEEKKTDDKAKPADSNNNKPSNGSATAAPAAAPNPPPPVLKGTLSYNLDLRRHIIRGMWNYENSNALPPQRFELLRTLDKAEDPKELPKDGEFHGSFSLAYFHTTSKGKQKERSKVINETGVKITFTKIDGTENEYKVDGRGTNQFGIFHINGTATPSQHEGDPCYDIILRKRYEPSQQPPDRGGAESSAGAGGAGDRGGGGGSKKRKSTEDGPGGSGSSGGPAPPPSESFPSGVVCLRGKLYKEEAEDLGATDVVHRINGMWSTGLDVILADPQNVQGLCNRFEYEHKSTVPSTMFPVSGRYSGWFHLTDANGQRQTITERDVNLRFTKNNAGYHNVEGKGSNVFGKYTISGTLSLDNVITIFRHFKPLKLKASRATSVTSAPPPINKGGQSSRRPSLTDTFPEPRLSLDEVIVPGGDDGEALDPIPPPPNTAYSAVSQGVLKLNEDGSHQCSGKWAVTREHFTSGQTSQFNFRLEPHFALEAVKEMKKKEGTEMEEPKTPARTPAAPQDFPLDSALYKGSFQLKKKANRYDTIVDQQIVMKFRKNTQGAYNVYGRGLNGIGTFNLIGTLIMRGKVSGQVELYRMYPPELLKTQSDPAPAPAIPGKGLTYPKATATSTGDLAPGPESSIATQLVPSVSTMMPGLPQRGALLRRESSRLVKLPSRLEDDDPQAQLARIMEKCVVILRQIREKDIERGAFFSEPVDPVALGIPTYRQVITEPMDLGTVARRLETSQINTPEEFARLVRLTFENAITFNVDPNHSVHLAARFLLVDFNKKFRDVDRVLESLRRTHKGADLVDDKGKKIKKKDDKKRKRGDEPRSAKRRRLDEAQAMTAANANAMAAIVAAAPQGVPNAAVSRGEFNMMIHMIELLQKQIVQTHNAIAELSPGDESEGGVAATAATSAPAFDAYASLAVPASAALAPAPEKKKPKKKAAEPAPKRVVEEPPAPPVVFDDLTKPLTLQEQETLTDTINNMPPDHIPGVIQIIRESASLNGDEDEIDLEIDQLDTVTQRKLLRHVSKVSYVRIIFLARDDICHTATKSAIARLCLLDCILVG